MNVNTWRIVFTAVWTFPAKNDPNFLIFLSKTAKIPAVNKKALFQFLVHFI